MQYFLITLILAFFGTAYAACDYEDDIYDSPAIYLPKIKPLKSHPKCNSDKLWLASLGDEAKEWLTRCLQTEAVEKLMRIDIGTMTPLKSHPKCDKCKDRTERYLCLQYKAWIKLIKDSSYPFTKAEIQELEEEQEEERKNEPMTKNGSGGISDQRGGLLGGGFIGTKSKDGVKAPNARDIDIGNDAARSKAEIMTVANQRMQGLRNIYDKYLKLKPDFTGNVKLEFTIAASGDIVGINIISSTTGYDEFDNDVKNMIATWKWKTIKNGNTTATIPFNFAE